MSGARHLQRLGGCDRPIHFHRGSISQVQAATLLLAAEAIVATLDQLVRYQHALPAAEVATLIDGDLARLRTAVADCGGQA